MANNFPKLKTLIDPGSSENSKQDKYHPKHIPRYIIFKMQKIKEKKKILESIQKKKRCYTGNKDKNNSRLLIRNGASKETME